MSNDSKPSSEGRETKLFKLMERWANETAEGTANLRSIRELARETANALAQLSRDMADHDVEVREMKILLNNLHNHCRMVWMEGRRSQGLRGTLDWLLTRTQQNPIGTGVLAVILVCLTILLTVAGLDLPSILSKLLGA